MNDYRVNIGAGVLLERAFFKFVDNDPRKNTEKLHALMPSLYSLYRSIIPDAIVGTESIDVKDTNHKFIFPYGGYFEVKASQNPLTPATNNYQLKAMLYKLPYAIGYEVKPGIPGAIEQPSVTASDHNVATLTFFMTYGSKISQELVNLANSQNVALFVSYAFLDRATGSFVFSTPERVDGSVGSSEAKPYQYSVNPASGLPDYDFMIYLQKLRPGTDLSTITNHTAEE